MFTPSMDSQLVEIGELYAKARKIRLTTVSKYAAKSARLLPDLKEGRCSITVARAMRIFQWFSDHWPADLGWPSDIPRPAPSPGSPASKEAA